MTTAGRISDAPLPPMESTLASGEVLLYTRTKWYPLQSRLRVQKPADSRDTRHTRTQQNHSVVPDTETRPSAVASRRRRRHTRESRREETADALTPSAQWPRRETSRSRPIGNTLEKRDTKREEHLSLKYGVWSSNMTVTTSRAWRYGSQQQPNTSGSAHREEEIGRAASWRRSSTAALRLQRLQRVR